MTAVVVHTTLQDARNSFTDLVYCKERSGALTPLPKTNYENVSSTGSRCSSCLFYPRAFT